MKASWRPPRTVRRLIVTVLLAAVCSSAAAGILNRWASMGPVGVTDRVARTALRDAMAQALITYALVRSLNGVISVAQETDLAVSPAGVGVRLAIGQILDPVNDLMERFSWVMLLSTAAIGIQQVLMQVGIWLGGGPLMAVAAALWAVGIWAPAGRWPDLRRWGMGLMTAAVMVRFALPMTVLGAEAVYRRFLEADYRSAAASLTILNDAISDKAVAEAGNNGVSEAAPEGTDGEAHPGWLDAFMAYVDGARKQLDLRGRIDRLKRQVGEYADWTVRLIVVFLVRTIIMPLILLGGIWIGGRLILRRVLMGRIAGCS